jgi:predicted transporter
VVSGIVVALYATSLALGIAGLAAALLGRAPGRLLLAGSVLVEAVLVVSAVAAVVLLARGHRPAETATFLAYLVGVLLVVPATMLWSLAERTRWSSLVLAVGGLTVAVMTVRMQVLWRAPGG